MPILCISSPCEAFYTAPQLGIYRIQHYLDERNVPCDILDSQIDDVDMYLAMSRNNYDCIALSGSHFAMEDCLALAARCKAAYPQALLVVGGVSPTHNPQDWIDAGFDFVILGYGEETLYRLYQYITTKSPNKEDINGLVYRKDGKLVIQPATVMTKQFFDQVTYANPLKMRIPYERYWAANQANAITDTNDFIVKTVRLFTASQCPNRCGYCSSKFIAQAQGHPTRIFSLTAEQVLDLVLADCEKYSPDCFFFNDDEFLFDKKRTLDFCKLIIDAKSMGRISEKIHFECQSRSIDFFKGEKADLSFIHQLRLAGFRRISVGAENFSDRLLGLPIMNKGWQSLSSILELFEIFKQEEILLQVNMMLLVPETTRQELIENIRSIYHFSLRNNPVNLNTYIRASPGAPALLSGAYPVQHIAAKSPLTGADLSIADYYHLRDPQLTAALQTLRDDIRAEEQQFLHTMGWEGRSLAKAYTTPLACMAILKALDEKDLYDAFKAIIYS